VFVETELWPNLIAACAQQQLPLTLVSARMSERSLQRYQRFAAGLMRQTVRAFSSIGTQSELDRERFIALGASPARVQAIGNLKFDFPLPADIARRGAELRAQHAPHSPLWVAGSTHAGEEDICLAAQRALQARARGQSMPVPLLVLAPRRPERFEAVARWLAERRDVDVLLVDQLGVLLDFYAAADVAFVGGSLVPVGGHNLLEPAAMGKPVLTGPHTFNSPQAAALLEAVGALQRVCNESELAEALWGLLTDGAHAQLVGAKAASAVAANQGAALRALSMITALAPVEQPSTSG
jgi:3-deoxy-D-manno-octulosonic-acid transferase